nr:MAG TPA: resistance protein [Caudoviricetes sp.]
MTIYDIDSAIAALVDPETGELGDYEAFQRLQLAREAKIENLALLYKETRATAEAIKAEVDRLTQRRRVLEHNMRRMQEYLALVLDGEKFASPRCAVSYRRSEATETDPEFVDWARENRPELLIEQQPKVDTAQLKRELKDGLVCDHARLVERQNVQVR